MATSGIFTLTQQLFLKEKGVWVAPVSAIKGLYDSAQIYFPGSSSTWYLNGSATTQSPGSANFTFATDEVNTGVTVLKATSSSSAYYRLGNSNLTMGTTHSIGMWYRSGSGSSPNGQMLWGNDVLYGSLGLNIWDGSSGTMGWYLNNGDGWSNPLTTAYTSTNTAWSHYVVTFDGTAAKMYRNGTLLGTAPTYKSYSNGGYNSNQFVIGSTLYSGGYPYNSATGRFTNFAVWNNKVLTTGEMTTLYNSNNPTNVL